MNFTKRWIHFVIQKWLLMYGVGFVSHRPWVFPWKKKLIQDQTLIGLLCFCVIVRLECEVLQFQFLDIGQKVLCPWYFELFTSLCILINAPCPAKEKRSIMLQYPHASLSVWCSVDYALYWLYAKYTFLNLGQKVKHWSHLVITHFPIWFGMTEIIFGHSSNRLAYSLVKETTSLPPYPTAQTRKWPVSARDSCSSFSIAVCLLTAFPISFLLWL